MRWGESQRKITVIALSTLLFELCGSAEAQQPKKVPTIGFLSSTGPSKTPGVAEGAFRRGLRDLGYVEGKNVVVEYRYSEGKFDRYPELVS